MNVVCLITRAKIDAMFQNYTPENVDKTKEEINPHLLRCAECREYLNAQFEKKRMENEKNGNGC
jgi:predicted anti-sigma-YlaC factor YlaD